MRRRLIAAMLVMAIPVLATAPVGAEERPRLRIVIPAHLFEVADAQPSPANKLPKQSNRNFLAAVVVVAAVVVLGVVVTAKYGD